MRKITSIFIISLVVIIAVYDVYAIAKGGVESSISHMMIEWSYKYPMFPFMMGVLVGHLFWRMRDTEYTKQISEDTRNRKE